VKNTSFKIGLRTAVFLTLFLVSKTLCAQLANPVLKAKITDGEIGANLTSPSGLAINDNIAYVFSGGNIELFDISNPSDIQFINKVVNGKGDSALRGPRSMKVVGTLGYITTSDGVAIMDLSIPTEPK